MMLFPVIEQKASLLGLWAIFAYCIGSIPFGLVLTQLFGLGDLRKIGSGNIGATNVLRTGNKFAALATLLLDAGKGGIMVLLAYHFVGEDAAQIAALFAMIGHCYPVWIGFRGGKGVATYLGTLWALNWMLGAVACLAWLLVAIITRISSLSALIAALVTLPATLLLGSPSLFTLLALLTVLMFWRHQGNIKRLLQGQEPKIGKSKK